MKEYYSIIKIDESLDEQIEIPKKVLESEVYKVAIDILHEGEYWLHTHRKKTLDDSMELIEQYANQKVIEELEIIAKEINSFTATNRIEKRLLNKIKELRGKTYKGRQTTMQNKWKKKLGYEVNK